MSRMKRFFRPVLIAALVIFALSSCDNPLIDEIVERRLEASSPVLVLTLGQVTPLDQGDIIDFAQVSVGGTSDIVIKIKNSGKSSLHIRSDEIVLTGGSGTEAGNFTLVSPPANEIAVDEESAMTLRFTPVSGGAKSATLTIPSDDFHTPAFTLSVKGNGWSVILTTNNATLVEETTATGGGEITDDGGSPITERGICWGTSPNPTIADSFISDAGVGLGSYSSMMSGLTAGSFYYVRSYAKNGVAIGYGTQVSFTTKPAVPSVPAVSTVGYPAGSGKLNVSWTSVNGSSTVYDVYYSETSTAPGAPNGPMNLTANSCTLEGLTNYAEYHVWVRAKNPSGTTGLSSAGTSMVGVPVTGIAYDRSPQVLLYETTETITAAVVPADATNPVINWTSNNPVLATVSEGIISTGVTPGTVTITASAADGQGVSVTFSPQTKPYTFNTLGPAGGNLFYDSGEYGTKGWRYLEMGTSSIDNLRWSNFTQDVSGAVSHALGAGKENTEAIIAAEGAGNYFAMACYNYSLNGFSDWYMPSAGEANLFIAIVGNPPGFYISSSSQYNGGYFYAYNDYVTYPNWNWAQWGKTDTNTRTWPVRRF